MSSRRPRPGWRWRLAALYALAFASCVAVATVVGLVTAPPDWVPPALVGVLLGLSTGPLVVRWRTFAARERDGRGAGGRAV